MLRGLDHVVVVVPDLPAAMAAYRALGFTVVPGGRHPPPAGTRNALIALADGAYVELIAFDAPAPAHRWWAPLQAGGGLVDLCARTDDLDGDARALRAAGVELSGPVERTRLRPDGHEVRWQLALPGAADRGVVPFLIRDETPRAERVPAETRHANGATGIAAVTIAVTTLDGAAAAYGAVLPAGGEAVRRADLQASGLRLRLGPHAVELVRPDAPASPIAAWLAARGPSPYAATLSHAGSARGALDPARTQGARLAWE